MGLDTPRGRNVVQRETGRHSGNSKEIIDIVCWRYSHYSNEVQIVLGADAAKDCCAGDLYDHAAAPDYSSESTSFLVAALESSQSLHRLRMATQNGLRLAFYLLL